MSRLILVRHGQARPFDADSDRLSDHGMLQARKLGAWLAAQDVKIDAAYCGTLRRQRETIAAITSDYVEDPRWNEYDATGVQVHLGPLLAERDEQFASIRRVFEADRANHTFQPMFERLMNAYIAGEVTAPELEPWAKFKSRVRAALDGIADTPGSGRTVLVVTSGGPIAAAVQLVLDAPPPATLDLHWRVRNSSVTEFLFSKGRISLDVFNATPHLAPGEITYR